MIYGYNAAVLLILSCICLIYGYNIHNNLINSPDSNWWLIISLLGSLFVISIGLVAGTMIRLFLFGKD